MNIEQEARDLLNKAVCRALEARNEVQAAFDAYRREVAEAIAYCVGQGMSFHHRDTLERFIIPEPVDPLTIIAREMVVADGVTRTKNQEDAIRSGRSGEAAAAANEDRLRAALAKIGGKITFEGEGA